MDEATHKFAKTLWDYGVMHHKLEKADCIFALGSYNPIVASYAADLFLAGWADFLVFSGGVVHPESIWPNSGGKTEAEIFLQIAKEKGVPAARIIVENEAKNTGDNFLLTDKLFKQLGFDFEKIIIVQKPYAERRAYAAGMVHWGHKKLVLSSPNTTYREYLDGCVAKDVFINSMVGDVQRIKIYPEKGFQIHQDIPENVWAAYTELVKRGFNKRLG